MSSLARTRFSLLTPDLLEFLLLTSFLSEISLEISKWVQRYGAESQIVPLDLQTSDPR